MNKSFSLAETITTLSLLTLGFYIGIRGVYWGFSPSPTSDSDFYSTLNDFMSLQYFGYIILFSAICLIISSISFGFIKKNNISNYFMAIGGVIGFIVHFLMATASYNNSLNWLTTWQLGILSILLGAIGVYSVVDIYAKRK